MSWTKKDAAYCNRCAVHGYVSGVVCCNYILVTGHRRGCPAGYGCNKRIIGKNTILRRLHDDMSDDDIQAFVDGKHAIKPISKQGRQKPAPKKRGVKSTRKPLNNSALDAMLADTGLCFRDVSRSIGYNKNALSRTVCSGEISAAMAKAILDKYGVDLVDHSVDQ